MRTKGLVAMASRAVMAQVVGLGLALSACGTSSDGDGGGEKGGSESGGDGGGGSSNGGTSGGGTGGSGTGGGSALETIDAYCEAYFSALAAYYQSCFASVLDWALLLDASLICPRMIEAEAAGRLVYTPSAGTACVAALSAGGCSVSEDDLIPVSSCGTAVAGTVALDGECTSVGIFDVNECTGSAYCGGGDAYACTRTCVPFREENETCDLAARCAPDLTCQNDVCVPDIEAGVDEPCEGPDAPSCASELYCEGASSTAAGTCQPTRTSGPCASGDECATGYTCNSSGTCSERKSLGEACVEGEQQCLLLDHCSSGRCTGELAAEGELCVTAPGEVVPCEHHLFCDLDLGECIPRKAVGEACTGPSECGGEKTHCDIASQTCAPCIPP